MKRCIKLSYYFCVRCNRKRGCPCIRPINGITIYKLIEYNKWHRYLPDKDDIYYTREEMEKFIGIKK